jgi:hypothetical protein
MAFLDNSGDIIIDAVLTDTGRYRLAQGDGSFAIEKFALGDDEVDYGLYNLATGSAYADLEIMQTPVLEAFTNNASSLKSKLITITRNNILYMPVLMANNLDNPAINSVLNMYVAAVDIPTQNNATGSQPVLKAATPGSNKSNVKIRVDQGIDNPAISPSYTIETDLEETQYIIEMDNRLGSIVSSTGNKTEATYIDDDQIASYMVTLSQKGAFVTENTDVESSGQVIRGPRGTTLTFNIQASIDLSTSTYLFNEIGTAGAHIAGITGNVSYIDSTVRVQGATTGTSVDLPIRFVKSE